MAQLTPPVSTEEEAQARRRLVLVKGRHHWIFRWTPGDERAVIDAAADMCRRHEPLFDLFDAATVCRQIEHTQERLPADGAA